MKEPTPEQCSAFEKVFEDDTHVHYAVWYPQMGGYSGRAIAVFDKGWKEWPGWKSRGGCVEVYVWHDGEFPFRGEDGERSPAYLHHCCPSQFVDFGEKLDRINESLKIVMDHGSGSR